MKRVAWWVGFLFAVWVLSRVFQSWRWFAAGDTIAGALGLLGFGLLLIGSILYLGFFSYEAERARGNVKNRIGIYEWFLKRREKAAPGS